MRLNFGRHIDRGTAAIRIVFRTTTIRLRLLAVLDGRQQDIEGNKIEADQYTNYSRSQIDEIERDQVPILIRMFHEKFMKKWDFGFSVVPSSATLLLILLLILFLLSVVVAVKVVRQVCGLKRRRTKYKFDNISKPSHTRG